MLLTDRISLYLAQLVTHGQNLLFSLSDSFIGYFIGKKVTKQQTNKHTNSKGRVQKKKKKSDIYHLEGEGGGQRGSIITFYFFFVPNALKIISRH